MPHRPTTPTRRKRAPALRRRLLALVVLLTALLAAAPAQSATPTHATAAASQGVKPTVVLVHGAWADSGSWDKVVARLQRAGYPVRVPPNPLRSLPGDSATIASFLATIPGPVILIGHSYGGAVITNAATGNPAVKALVYVDAFAPDEGETILPLTGPYSALTVADPNTVFDFVPYPGAPAGDVDLYLKRDVFLTSFANGVPRGEAAVLWATQRPITGSSGNQPSGVPAWETIPSWYLIGTRDLVIPPSAQQFMATRAGSTIVPVNAGHLGLVSNPQAVTDLIIRADRSTR